MCALFAPVASERPPVKAGRHKARCVTLVDLGLQRDKKYQSDEYETKHKIFVTFELNDEHSSRVHHRYSFSLGKKSRLGSDIATWLFGGDWPLDERAEFDLESLVGKYGTVEVGHTANDNPKILGVYARKKDDEEFETGPLAVYTDGQWKVGDERSVPNFVLEDLSKALNPDADDPSDEEWT